MANPGSGGGCPAGDGGAGPPGQTGGPDGRPLDPAAVPRGLFAVHVCGGQKPPPNAYVAVHDRGYRYFIDDTDRETRATFARMAHLSRLDFHRQPLGNPGPTLTLPVDR